VNRDIHHVSHLASAYFQQSYDISTTLSLHQTTTSREYHPMCNCPNGSPGYIAFLATLVLAEVTTIFSPLYVLLFGLFAMSCNILPSVQRLNSSFLLVGSICSWLVALGQIITAAITAEGAFSFCKEFGFEEMYCDPTLYKAMNAIGGFLWLVAGIVALQIPDPDEAGRLPTKSRATPCAALLTNVMTKPRKVQHETKKSMSTLDHGKHVITNTLWTNPNGTQSVTEAVEDTKDCNV